MLVRGCRLSEDDQVQGSKTHRGDQSEQCCMFESRCERRALMYAPYQQQNVCEVKTVWTNRIVANISQYICVSNYHIAHIKLTQCYVNYMSIQLGTVKDDSR